MAHAAKKIRTWALLPPALALLTACSGFSVRYDYDRNAAFAGLRTWDWAPAPPREGKAPAAAEGSLMDRRVRQAVAAELAARGFRQDPGGRPDFQVVYYPVYRRRVIQTYSTTGPLWGWGWGGPRPWGYGPVMGYGQVQTYEEGTIVLEVRDPGRNQVIWQASAAGALDGLRDPRDADEQVARAVKDLLARFPPPANR